EYADGSHVDYQLENPVSWAPIEQDFYTDEFAFAMPYGAPLPLRLCLEDGTQTRNPGDLKGISGVEPRRIPGGAGILLDLPLDNMKEITRISLRTLSNDVVTGIIAMTIGK
ncbi:MAG: DUF4450 domain-containing protein, partial [Muribaculaceae bacterium]|nr:DUF4450 domain-containing protein [Muribaculaceae bacterium]